MKFSTKEDKVSTIITPTPKQIQIAKPNTPSTKLITKQTDMQIQMAKGLGFQVPPIVKRLLNREPHSNV